ncbi:hypothetical protein ACEWY4_012464 [Coilia grayii]|uniref:Transcription cofactor vestigial-like protein 4 n=1 Tax=Coilia grayii TaxID=363190 RepID=A0ABD1K0K4_9TELE
MAVTNFHYITRMNSGFKVYILEGQPHLRSEDRYRHVTSERMRMIPAHPIKRKHSSERGLTLEERRERVLSKHAAAVRRSSVNSVPESPSPSSTSTWSPAPSPAHSPTSSPLALPAYAAPVLEEPLALIKKPRRESGADTAQERPRAGPAPTCQIQMRPSVITCVSSATRPSRGALQHCTHTTVVSGRSCDRVEEHFQRSLGANYHKAASPLSINAKATSQLSINAKATSPLSISGSVDDHFAKALGDKWHQIKGSSSSSSTPPSPSSSSSPPSSPLFLPPQRCVTHTSPTHTPRAPPRPDARPSAHTSRAPPRPDARPPTLWIIK